MFIRKFKNGINSIRHNYTYTKIKDLSEKQVGNTINIKVRHNSKNMCRIE